MEAKLNRKKKDFDSKKKPSKEEEIHKWEQLRILMENKEKRL